MICRGCRFTMSFTEYERGQSLCNRCLRLIDAKAIAHRELWSLPLSPEERRAMQERVGAMPLPEYNWFDGADKKRPTCASLTVDNKFSLSAVIDSGLKR
jgi:transcription initiation factor TFIIIB Brf1 subunit/transcription initiation factor TFIIB